MKIELNNTPKLSQVKVVAEEGLAKHVAAFGTTITAESVGRLLKLTPEEQATALVSVFRTDGAATLRASRDAATRIVTEAAAHIAALGGMNGKSHALLE